MSAARRWPRDEAIRIRSLPTDGGVPCVRRGDGRRGTAHVMREHFQILLPSHHGPEQRPALDDASRVSLESRITMQIADARAIVAEKAEEFRTAPSDAVRARLSPPLAQARFAVVRLERLLRDVKAKGEPRMVLLHDGGWIRGFPGDVVFVAENGHAWAVSGDDFAKDYEEVAPAAVAP